MHRSGTSLVAQLLYRCGLSMGTEDIFLPQTEENPSGYWEIGALAKFNDTLLEQLGGSWDEVPRRLYAADWLEDLDLQSLHAWALELISSIVADDRPWGWKDPRNSILLPFWRTLYPELKLIICLRNPLEVAFSLSRRLWAASSFQDSLTLWRDYYDLLWANMDQDNTIVTHYESYFWKPEQELARICDFTGLSPEADQIEQSAERSIDPLQYRCIATERMLAEHEALPPRLLDLYNLFKGIAGEVFQACLADAGYQKRKRKALPVRNFMASIAALDEASERIDSLERSIADYQARYPHSDRRSQVIHSPSLVDQELKSLESEHAQTVDRLQRLEAKVQQATDGVALLRSSLLGRIRILRYRLGRLPRRFAIKLRSLVRTGRLDGEVSAEGLFDEAWYLGQRFDVAAACIDGFWHYSKIGWREGSDPSPYFNVDYYLSSNLDVEAAGMEPLDHYSRQGWQEGRNPSPYFDVNYYLSTSLSGSSQRSEPLSHYVKKGWKQGCNPNPYFDVAYYLAENPDVADAGMEPLRHYMHYGWKEGRNPSPKFDVDWYLLDNPDVSVSGEEPLAHYSQSGSYEGRMPTPFQLGLAGAEKDEGGFLRQWRILRPGALAEKRKKVAETGLFDRDWYELAYPDVHASGMDPLDHYVKFGAREGRNPNPLFNTKIYLHAQPQDLLPEDALVHFYQSGRASTPGAYRSPDVLVSLQQSYQRRTKTDLLADRRSGEKHFAVYLQCGAGYVNHA
jgi:hypothetical protein